MCATSCMTPFMARWTLDRPMIVSQQPVHLDALIAWARIDEEKMLRGGDLDDEAATAASLDLPLARIGTKDDWCWKASWLVARMAVEAHGVSSVRKTDVADFAARQVAPGNPGGVYVSRAVGVNLGAGAHKAYFLTDRAQWTTSVEAYGVGDLARVEALLARVAALGAKTRNGYGRVRTLDVTPAPAGFEEAWRWRPAPATLQGSEGFGTNRYALAVAPLRPPYWDRLADTTTLTPTLPFDAFLAAA